MIRNGTAKERVFLVKKLHSEGRTKAEIHAITGIGLPTVKKYIELPEEQISERGKTIRGKEHEAAMILPLSAGTTENYGKESLCRIGILFYICGLKVSLIKRLPNTSANLDTMVL